MKDKGSEMALSYNIIENGIVQSSSFIQDNLAIQKCKSKYKTTCYKKSLEITISVKGSCQE